MLTSILNQRNYLADREIPLDADSRYELKYRLTYFQYLKMRNAIRPYMIMDPFTRAQETQRYLVRSLYFDTDDYHSFDQKMNGDCDRVKLRLRTYPYGEEYLRYVRVELKVRQGNRAVKKSVFVPIDEYRHFMANRHWQSFDHPITNSFERTALKQHMRPKVLVEYDREGYQTRLKSGLRVTFDHSLRAAHAKDLFPEHSFYRYLYPRRVVLEIKFKDQLPKWLEALVRQQGLKVIANSKYTQCIQVARHDLHHPGGVILVR